MVRGGRVWGCTKTGGRGGADEPKRGEGRRGRGRWGFDPFKDISKYITFKGSKGRDLLKRRIFSFFIKPLKGFYKKGKNHLLRKDRGQRVLRG